MTVVMKIESLADGRPSAFDGQYLKEYDPNRDGVAPTGARMPGHIVCTDDPEEAMHFDDAVHLHRVWTLIDGRAPVRFDGKPNRPLTAFTVSSVPLR